MADQPILDCNLSAEQQETLRQLLDEIIPADPTRNKPSAAEIGVLAYLLDQDSAYLTELRVELDTLDEHAQAQTGRRFVESTGTTRTELTETCKREHPQIFQRLVAHTAACYYQDGRAMQAIGLPPRPPYPEGYTVRRGDLTLLEPVRQRGSIWRRT